MSERTHQPPEPDTSYHAPYSGHTLKYHSVDQIIEYGNRRAVEAVTRAFTRANANASPGAEPLEVVVDRGRVWLKRGHRSLMFAYRDTDPLQQEWYANQVREVLGLPIEPAATFDAAPARLAGPFHATISGPNGPICDVDLDADQA